MKKIASQTDKNYYRDDIIIENFDISFGKTILFQNASVNLVKGHKYGFVGANGSGKSTLMKHISSRKDKFSNIPGHFDIHLVEQEIFGNDMTAIECVISADTERTSLLEQVEHLEKSNDLEDGEKLAQVYARLKEIDSDLAIPRASVILNGLQFNEEMKQRATKDFSGGWRMRISLARALFARPSLLLLDEPTNHLDLNATLWLNKYLSEWKNTLLLVSHDQDFLNNICTDIYQIYDRKLIHYKGNYDSYKSQFSELRKIEWKNYDLYEKKRKQLNREKSNQNSKQRKNRRKMLNKIPKNNSKIRSENEPVIIARPSKTYDVNFEFPNPEPLAFPIINVENANFGYSEEKTILKNLNFGIGMDSRIALVGPNGAGKSTLLNLIKGTLEPTSGSVTRNRKLKIAHFSQHFVDQLVYDENPVEYLLRKFEEYDELEQQDIRKILGKFGLSGKSHLQQISSLSGGQKSRVVIAEICMLEPHILLLDEPTNHLDIESIDALIVALKEYKGAVIIASHDARLLREVVDTENDDLEKGKYCEIWVVGDESVTKFDGSFDDFRDELITNLLEKEELEYKMKQ